MVCREGQATLDTEKILERAAREGQPGHSKWPRGGAWARPGFLLLRPSWAPLWLLTALGNPTKPQSHLQPDHPRAPAKSR